MNNEHATLRIPIKQENGTPAVVVIQLSLESEQPDGPPTYSKPSFNESIDALLTAGRHARSLYAPTTN